MANHYYNEHRYRAIGCNYRNLLNRLKLTDFTLGVPKHENFQSIIVTLTLFDCKIKMICPPDHFVDRGNSEMYMNNFITAFKSSGSMDSNDFHSRLVANLKLQKETELLDHKYGHNDGMCLMVYGLQLRRDSIYEKDDGIYKFAVTFPLQNSRTNEEPHVYKNIDNMTGQEFEIFCADLLKKRGYTEISITQGSGDQGLDLIAYRDGVKFGIQCKHYSSSVGNKAVQEAYAGKKHYGCHVGIVMTNNQFTNAAIDLARTNEIVLWDRQRVLSMINEVELNNARTAEEENTENSPDVTTAQPQEDPTLEYQRFKKYTLQLLETTSHLSLTTKANHKNIYDIAFVLDRTNSKKCAIFCAHAIDGISITNYIAQKVLENFRVSGCNEGLIMMAKNDSISQLYKQILKSNGIDVVVFEAYE